MRAPLGTYIRTMADWWTTQSVTAGAQVAESAPPASNFCVLSLYNDQMQGWLLYLDAIDIWCGTNVLFTYHVEGVDGKDLINGTPIYSGLGKQPGVIYHYNSASAPPLAPVNSEWSGIFNVQTGANPYKMRARGPLAVIKPGYSYNVMTPEADGFATLTATFYWTALNG